MIGSGIRRWIFWTIVVLAGILGPTSSSLAEGRMVLYVQTGCNHCAKVEEFIEKHELTDEFTVIDILAEEGAAEEFTQRMDELNVPVDERGVPILVYDEDQWVGGDTPILEFLLDRYDIPEESDPEGLAIIAVGGVFMAGFLGYGIVSFIHGRRLKKKS